MRAAAMAGLREVPCLVAQVDEQDAGMLALIENLQRRDLDCFEEAAAIAREDSPEGETLRKRLAEYGADNAMDRAELFMARREREAFAAQQQAGMAEAANRNFVAVVRQAHPDLFEASRSKADNERFQADMQAWIEQKPYAEAAPLMDVFLHGRDPHAVAELITRFKNERQAPQKARTNPDGAFAVPRRAGWNI